LTAPLQFIGNGQQVDRDTLFMQAGKCFPNPLVTVDIEVVGIQELGDVVIDFRVNKNRPHDGFFGFSTMRDCR
jgi:hypothetical protein